MKMEQTECSETSTYKIQTPGNYQKESIQHTEHGESLKLRNISRFVHRQKQRLMAGSKGFESMWDVAGISEGKVPLGLDVWIHETYIKNKRSHKET